MYSYLVLLHLLGATVWTGGHLILACVILPPALRSGSAEALLSFESRFEKIGLPALLIQVVTGLALAHTRIPEVTRWLDFSDPSARLVATKLALLALTIALAADARLRLIPSLGPDKLRALAWHIVPVTVLSVAFVVVGASFRGLSWW